MRDTLKMDEEMDMGNKKIPEEDVLLVPGLTIYNLVSELKVIKAVTDMKDLM